MTGACIVLITVSGEQEAEAIARTLVEEHLVACVTVTGPVRSIYRWKGAVESATEVLMLVKTLRHAVPALRSRIQELHSYEVPEFLVLDVAEGSDAYLHWIAASVR